MKSLGVIETRGLVAAVQAVDAACKAAGVTCIGYRKVGSGLVSVCFEGEISAIHTAIDRGVAVAGVDQPVASLVIARPERCVVEALSNLKGHPPREEALPDPVHLVSDIPASVEQPENALAPLDEKNGQQKKGKRT